MRSLPLLLALLIVATLLGLGLSVMLGQPSTKVPDAVGPASAAGLPQGHVYTGITSEPDDVNPFTAHGTVARRFVLGLTHEGLVDTDPATGELRGALAQSWQPAEDGMSCTFVLREGVLFSDGTPVTMEDVLFGWELARAGHLPLGFVGDAFGRVGAAEALDERRLRVTFRERYYAAVRAVGESWLVAQRRFFVDRVGGMAERLGEARPAVDSPRFAALLGQIDRVCGPGTGPFELPFDDSGPTTWRRRQEMVLVRNEHHWRRLVEPGTWNLAGVRLLFRRGAAIANAMHNAEVDWVGVRSADDVLREYPELGEHYRKLTYDYATLGVIGVVWNCRHRPFDDPRVRRALGMLFDRDAIVASNPGRAVPAFAFAKPGSPGYPEVTPLPFDVGKARHLLRGAGFDPSNGNPLRVRIVSPRDGGIMDLSLSLLADAAHEAGVELTVESLPFQSYVARKVSGDWDGLMVNRSFRPWGDPYAFVHSRGMDNDGDWSDPEADRLAAAARVELDPARRAGLWRELHERVYAEQPFTFLVHPRACILFNRFIQGAEPGPRGLWPERWWVPPEHQRK